jgi:hypothetical protein
MRVEGCLTGGVDVVCLSEVDLVGRHEADAGVMMVLVVPGEKNVGRTHVPQRWFQTVQGIQADISSS